MAVIAPTITTRDPDGGRNLGYVLVLWETLTESDTVTEYAFRPVSGDKTVQVTGTFGGATITLQGSLDGATWFNCTGPDGNDLAFTSAGGGFVVENCIYYRVTTAGGSSSDVDVYLMGTGG